MEALAKFQSVEEPGVCKYVVTICTPLLCPAPVGDSAQAPHGMDLEPRSFLSPLNNLCFQRRDGWWTYELCFDERVRQMQERDVPRGAQEAWGGSANYGTPDFDRSAYGHQAHDLPSNRTTRVTASLSRSTCPGAGGPGS